MSIGSVTQTENSSRIMQLQSPLDPLKLPDNPVPRATQKIPNFEKIHTQIFSPPLNPTSSIQNSSITSTRVSLGPPSLSPSIGEDLLPFPINCDKDVFPF